MLSPFLNSNLTLNSDSIFSAYSALSPEIEKEGGIFVANSAKWSPNRKSLDSDLQTRLWDISVELTGMEG